MKRKHAKKAIQTTIAASLACLSPQLTLAHGEDATDKIEDLGTTTAVARRATQDISSTTSKLHTLDADSLRNSQIHSLTRALETLPGVNISRSGQAGVIQGVRVRGLRPGDTQFRIDGVRYTRRTPDLDSLVSQLSNNGFSRVELLKGAQASLYGSSANGGVVNLTTKYGSKESYTKVKLEAGSFNSLSLDTEDGGSIGKLSYYLSSRYSTTDNDTYGDNSETANRDNDYISYSEALRLAYAVNDDLELGLTYRNIDSQIETPSAGKIDNNFYLGTIFADYQVTEKWKSKLTLSFLIDNSQFPPTTFSPLSQNDYDQFGMSWENAYQYSGKGSVSFGAEYENQDFRGPFGAENGYKDHYLSAYVNHTYELQNFSTDIGLRYEDYQSFGNHTSWKTGLRYDLEQTNTILTANVGTGFNTPTLIQLYSPLSNGVAGNPNLDPETSLGWDLGIEQKLHENHTASVTFFETDIEKAIQRNQTIDLFANTPGKSKASGIEASFDGDITNQLAYELSYTWLDRSLNGQPQQTAKAQLAYTPNDKTILGFGAQYLDKRSYGGDTINDTFIVRAYGSYQLTDNVRFNARIENLTDTEYNHYAGFGNESPTRRLGVFGGVTIDW